MNNLLNLVAIILAISSITIFTLLSHKIIHDLIMRRKEQKLASLYPKVNLDENYIPQIGIKSMGNNSIMNADYDLVMFAQKENYTFDRSKLIESHAHFLKRG
ncbi:hypothetical protein [Maridesulfovibrio sp.]|uniref:hypothetical protein n=1 Tax=Maridesulfovibrio sp. TaxID=2795000 RepID=UPI002A18DA35|nr:hypothetical protein [Maridesulfovibrio sp.]